MWKKISLLVLGFLFSLALLTARSARAQTTVTPADLEQKIKEYDEKISQLQGEQKTLSDLISYLNNKIGQSQTRIQKTNLELAQLESDIATLSGQINVLDISLDQLTDLLVNRIEAIYKHKSTTNPVTLLFSSTGLSDFFNRLHYLRIIQSQNRQIIVKTETARTNFDLQKQVKEQKQAEAEAARKRLEQEKAALASQQAAKQKLLSQTKNDEKKYQTLKAEAQRQLFAFRRFVTSQGGASILSGQTKCNDWGCYYNQRDSQWGNMLIGNSDSSVAEYGCLITSMAMIASYYDKSIKPSDIAASPDVFVPGTAYMWQGSWTVSGITTTRTRVSMSTAKIDEEVNTGRPVIVGLFSGPDHFIVIKGKNDQGYIMNDPFLENGGDRPFSDKYQISDITTLDLVTVN